MSIANRISAILYLLHLFRISRRWHIQAIRLNDIGDDSHAEKAKSEARRCDEQISLAINEFYNV